MKRLFALLVAMWTYAAWADVTEVRVWKPAPGRSAEMMKSAMEAKAIHEKLGANVFVGVDQMGNLQYGVAFADWGGWAAFNKALQTSKDWQAFWTKYDVPNPNSTNVSTFYLNQPLVAKTQAITAVYSWDIDYKVPGAFDRFMAEANESAKIHSALGASPGIDVDQIGNVHYELTFDSWASWAKFGEALMKDAQWNALTKRTSEHPTAELANVTLIETYTGP
jgi:hypothetical protein